MRYALFLLLLMCTPLRGAAQQPTTLEGWADRLKAFGQQIPQEEIFIHTDNSCYYLGDTLYFKAYMRLSDGRPSPLSRLLYVELLNHDGYLVERQKIEMKAGQGHGSFCLSDTLYGGYYELRAYTRWQLNWGLYEHPHTKAAEDWFYSKAMAKQYYRDYEKLYSRVFPVYDKPKTAGDYAQDMTLRPLRRYYKQTEEEPRAVVSLYPEGGSLVAGVPCRVAFEANDENGKHLRGKLRIKNEELRIDIEAETESRGRGAFVFTPPAKGKVKASFEWDGNSQEVELPQIESDGVAMQARVEADGIHVSLHCAGKAVTDPLGLTASCHGILKDFQTIIPSNMESPEDRGEVTVPIEKLPTGVIQLTVFNAEGRIYADRLVFVRQTDFKPQNICFEGVKEQYEPYDEVNISLSAPSRSTISLAVRDAVNSDYTFDSATMMTEMLLGSQVRGFVEQPEYYFETDDETHRRALDLLLMVQGWRRYSWYEMATPGAFTLREPYERTELLTGVVNKYLPMERPDEIRTWALMRDAVGGTSTSSMQQITSGWMSSLDDDSFWRDESLDTEDSGNGDALLDKLQSMQTEANARFDADQTNQGSQSNANGSEANEQFLERYGEGNTLKREVLVHAEFAQPGAKGGESMVEGDMETFDGGKFRIEAPRFDYACYMFLSASDTTKWKKGEEHLWTAPGEDKNGNINYPEFYVKFNPIHPRFPKPYNYYQQNLPTRRTGDGRRLTVDDDVILMDEVTIGAKRGGLRKFDASKPAFVLDAYDAFNEVCDAGLNAGYYVGAKHFVRGLARTYIGDMNIERPYRIEQRWDGKNMSSYVGPGTMMIFNHQPRIDKVYIYTDYSPRREGDEKFEQSNQPTVHVDLHRYADDSQRMTWRDRRLLLTGFAICEDFYQPDYSKQKPTEPTDYRRTLYWNPDLQLDAEGRARVRFFTGSHPTQIVLSAEGMAADGQPLSGISYPEDR